MFLNSYQCVISGVGRWIFLSNLEEKKDEIKTKQNKTKQNKTKQNKTKQTKNKTCPLLLLSELLVHVGSNSLSQDDLDGFFSFLK